MGTGQERCKRCDRAECPTLTMPDLWGRAYRGVGFSVQSQLPGAAKARREAMKNCRAHAVDWRKRALDAEARERWISVEERLPQEGATVDGVIYTEHLGAVRTLFTFTGSQWVSLSNRRYPLEAVQQWKPFWPAAPEV